MKITFNINFNTKIGEKLQLKALQDDGKSKYYFLQYKENGNWQTELETDSKTLVYKYQLTDEGGNILDEEFTLHQLKLPKNFQHLIVYDVWNLKNFPENYLNNKIFKNKLNTFKPEKKSILKKHTHLFRIEAPIYNPDWRVVLLGETETLGNWEYLKTIPLSQTDFGIWEVALHLTAPYPLQYKYGLMDTKTGEVFSLEYGENRVVQPNLDKEILHIQNDHFFRFKSDELYHAAGVAVPVFSLRTEDGFGVGEFSDIKKLADWAKKTNLGIIQILPINDTTANYSWTDSYPYAAISVYALHPLYLSIENLDFKLPKKIEKEYQTEKAQLNDLNLIDYEQVITGKWKYVKQIFQENKEKILKDKAFKKFLKENKNWLLPYSAFCVQRDKYKTPNFSQWKTHKKYIPAKISAMYQPKHKDYEMMMLHSWVQYQLHIQLKNAIDYTHTLGISVKGDLPIGIYRYSVEAWAEPEFFGMHFQAGAPPDQFAELGQNWEFPTYNWEAMKTDGYQWWKNRLKALEQYFDAMRIDHILGFFRIWRMPISAVQGILGYFYPAIPVTLQEFNARNLSFDRQRYCEPYINDQMLWDYFGYEGETIHNHFMNNHFNGTYSFKEEYNTQRKLKEYFAQHPFDGVEEKLMALSANVLFIEEEKENGEIVYHPRFNLAKTDSYKYLPDFEKWAIYEIYLDYFFKRQDTLWYKSAMQKLPMILNATDMLICGEDLGLVPDCVPIVMDKLGITALKVQRMPPGDSLWYDPKQASYLNVVTASSHDSSTLRQWWHEDRAITQQYFNYQLNQWGGAPAELLPEHAEIIMKQHLYNDAMLAIFPIQEFLATDNELRNKNEDEERINVPAIFPHYWRYRMHLSLEKMNEQKDFNDKIALWVQDSKRV